MKLFYCWQSDHPDDRNLIEHALKRAVKAVARDGHLSIEPVVDRDTRGLPGTPDITKAIFEKIDASAGVVADVTIVETVGNRSFCNPNVLVEVGSHSESSARNASSWS